MITKIGEHMVKTGFLGAAINAGKTLWNVGGKAMGPLMTGLMTAQYGHELSSGESSIGEVAGSAAGGYAGWKGVDRLLSKAPGPLRFIGGMAGGWAGEALGRAVGSVVPVWQRKPQTAQQYMGRNQQFPQDNLLQQHIRSRIDMGHDMRDQVRGVMPGMMYGLGGM